MNFSCFRSYKCFGSHISPGDPGDPIMPWLLALETYETSFSLINIYSSKTKQLTTCENSMFVQKK